jgi:hypothetical protein
VTGLARLLRREEQVSDLLAFLTDLDPAPLRRALGLRADGVRVRREVLVGGRSGRIDLLVENAAGSPVAVVEVKIGAGQHGRQYAVYDEWAAGHGLASHCWLVTLSGEDPDVLPSWRTDLTLPALVGAWRDSAHPQAAWLAAEAAEVLGRRAGQLEGPLGLADDPVVAGLLVKRLKLEFGRNPTAARVRARLASGMRTMVGEPMLLGWVPLPGREDLDVVMTFDLRSAEPRPRAWHLRLGLQVDPTGDRTSAEARVLAHDLATSVAVRLTRTAFVASLPFERQHLAEALAKNVKHDGLAGDPSREQLERWRAAAAAGEPLKRHPRLRYDLLRGGGLRLASQLPVEAESLCAQDMLVLVDAALDHLAGVAEDVARALPES